MGEDRRVEASERKMLRNGSVGWVVDNAKIGSRVGGALASAWKGMNGELKVEFLELLLLQSFRNFFI